ncbi:MAG: HD domain-containing protein [Rhodospirillales bacterium]|nr:HD domain-containing protein [Rhodospirillales bacterium]MBT4041505.1 HD domain-containing protein [Rhodospirillales bacterium]MBT4627510.1 HD domain-containing protein [Rhodospirillales bacterium]MBT5352912.1 HD domain-containing protein [Rhodospirillales bacterium]MBT5520214.1 HD domain-containing protein [Rhodospirillales bacterium]
MTTSIDDRVQKSLVFVVGGSLLQREEIAQNLKSFYLFELFESESAVSERLETAVPTAIIIDEILPPMGGAGLIAKVRGRDDTNNIPIVFTAEPKSAEMIAEATSYDRVFLVERPFKRGTFVGALSSGVNASVEAQWEGFEPIQKKALKNTLSSFNSIANLIQEGEPIPYEDVRDSCAPLVEAVQNNNFKDILSGVSEHDNYTYVHSLRVATFLSLFGNVLGMKGEDLMTLSTGGLLHDVGKMHIPHEVLNKPGKLTEDEYVIMQSHVNCTVDFLEETSELPKGVLIIAGQHHEKIDGTGYPYGLKGGKLNELARIASIIDIFSAITDRRVYKEPVPPEQALKIMGNMNKQLDQNFLGVFREMLLDGAT